MISRLFFIILVLSAHVFLSVEANAQHIHSQHPKAKHSHSGGKKVWVRAYLFNVGGQSPTVTVESDEEHLEIDRQYVNNSCKTKPFPAKTKKVTQTEAWSMTVNGEVGVGWESEYGSELQGDIRAAAIKLHAKTTFRANVRLGYDAKHEGSRTKEIEGGSPALEVPGCTTSHYQHYKTTKIATGSMSLPSHRGVCRNPSAINGSDSGPGLFDWNCTIDVVLNSDADSDLLAGRSIWLPDVIDQDCVDGCGGKISKKR